MNKILFTFILLISFNFYSQSPRAGGINNTQAAVLPTVHDNFVGVQSTNSNAFAVYSLQTNFDYYLGLKTTNNLAEGSVNKYFSNTLARNAFSAGTGLIYSAGVFGLDSATQGILASVANKFNIPTGTTLQYIDGAGNFVTFPSIPLSQVSSDWNSVSGISQILNKPILFSGSYLDLTDAPTIPAAQIQTDWNATTGLGVLLNKPILSTVAITGVYSDLSSKPTIPTDNNQLTNGSGYITASSTNTLTNKSGNISQWTNNSGYLTSFTELDPTIPAYSKTLSSFSIIKTSTDPLYKAIGYTPTSLEITTALGFTPYNSTNPAGYISSVPAQSFASLTGKPTTLTGYGITDAYPLTGNPSNFLTSVTSGQVTGALGYTPITNSRTLTINGIPFDLSANRSWTVGDVTTTTLTSGLATKESIITSGTNLQYWRGDKTWQTLNTAVIAELTNLYYTDSRARASISLTTTGSGAATYNNTTGVLNIPTLTGGTVTSITAGAGLSGGIITSSGTISMPNTGTPGTYNTVTTDTQGRVISGTVSTPSNVTVVLNTSSKISTAQATRVSYSVTHTIALTLLLSSGSSMAYLEISPDNSNWSTISQAGYSDGVAVAVVLTKTVTNNIQGEVPANYFRRIRVVTSGGGSATYTCGQETIY